MADSIIKFEVIAAPYYHIDGTRYEDYVDDSIKVGDILLVAEDYLEPDSDGDILGTVERTDYVADVSALVLKRLS